MQEVRRLLADRKAKQREIDAIDRALELAAGMDTEDRPTKPRMTREGLRRMSKIQ